jgi:hypothetical protein
MADTERIRPIGLSNEYLSAFPVEVYDLSPSSHVVKLATAVCGDGGVGSVRKAMFLSRLQTSLETTQHYDIDSFFGNTMRFPRLQSEVYSSSPSVDLLSAANWDSVRSQDASYRGRIDKFMRSFAYGGTLDGIRLAAQAACGAECVVYPVAEYYRENDIVEGGTGDLIGYLNTSNADYREVIVVPLTTSYTSEIARLIVLATDRVRPQDVVVTVASPSSFLAMFPAGYWTSAPALSYYTEVHPVEDAIASSEYFFIKRVVTGRADWPVETDAAKGFWIAANVSTEAPTQAYGQHQEEIFDNTLQVGTVSSSSNHHGEYNGEHKRWFAHLQDPSAREVISPQQALRRHLTKRVSASYYGGRNG